MRARTRIRVSSTVECTRVDTYSGVIRLPTEPFGYPRTSAVSCLSFVVSPWSRRGARVARSEEHTSELQSHGQLVCRLLLEKKKTTAKSARVGAVRKGAPR